MKHVHLGLSGSAREEMPSYDLFRVIFLQFYVVSPNLNIALATALPTSVTPVTNSSAISSLSLKGVIEPANNTHIKISIANTYPQDISILKWSFHFQAGAEHASFVVEDDINGSKQSLKPRRHIVNYRFARTRPSHFVNITAGGSCTGYFDLTDLFEVPEAGSYSVAMRLQTPVFLHSSNSILEQVPSHLQRLDVYSFPVTMHLAKSEPESRASRRQDGPRPAFPDDCSGGGSSSELESFARAAYLEATNLAKYAQGSTNDDLWKLYFNAPGQQSAVYNAYQGVLNYRAQGAAGIGLPVIREQCDPNNTDPICLEDDEPAAYYGQLSDGSVNIVFCKPFFSLPAASTCDFPSTNNQGMIERGGAFLHELIHVPGLNGGLQIGDGADEDNRCYDWDCVTEAAIGGGSQVPSWQLAKTYELYAYAARVIGTKSCKFDVATVTAPKEEGGMCV
ncbi:MAG: hypothetical protein Q9195_007096 [Heterodermia aff. obscurata]